MRKLQVRISVWLATCLLFLTACIWLSGTRPEAMPFLIHPAVSPQATQTANPPIVLAVQPTITESPTQLLIETPAQASVETGAPVDIQVALKHIEDLSENIGPRQAGTTNEAKAANYIETAFQSLGYKTSLQPFTFIAHDDTTQYSANVIAVKAGASTKEIIVGAHYDSVPVGKGADDNASGVAVMLAVAEMVKDLQTPYTIRFIAFGAEEAGLYGSGNYVKKMSAADIQNTTAMINLDSLIAGDTPNVYGNSSPEGTTRNWFLEYARSQGLDLQTQPVENLDNPDGSPCNCADYSAFQTVGIPFAYFEATDWTLGNKDGWTQVDPNFGKNGEIWNTKYDYLEYINQNFPGRVELHLNLFIRLLFGALTQFK